MVGKKNVMLGTNSVELVNLLWRRKTVLAVVFDSVGLYAIHLTESGEPSGPHTYDNAVQLI